MAFDGNHASFVRANAFPLPRGRKRADRPRQPSGLTGAWPHPVTVKFTMALAKLRRPVVVAAAAAVIVCLPAGVAGIVTLSPRSCQGVQAP
jgi:hypothetical protein